MSLRNAILILLILLSPTAPVLAEPAVSPAQEMLEDASDGSLDRFTLWRAALIASGAKSELLQSSARRFEDLLKRIQTEIQPTGNQVQTAEAVFRYMHREVLIGSYRSGMNDFAETLRTGDFNCVTATIVFNCLCRQCGVELSAIAAPAHVFSRLKQSGWVADVETTFPAWFDGPQRDRSPREGRELTDVQLLGKVYYNHGVRLLGLDRFAEALDCFEISLTLDSEDPVAKANQLAALNNWALAECRAERYETAAKLLARGRAINADYGPILANDLHVHHRWAQALCGVGQHARAFALLEQRRVDRPREKLFREGRGVIYRDWLRRAIHGQDLAGELDALRLARQALADQPHLASWEREAFLNAAKEVPPSQQVRLWEAWALLQR